MNWIERRRKNNKKKNVSRKELLRFVAYKKYIYIDGVCKCLWVWTCVSYSYSTYVYIGWMSECEKMYIRFEQVW